MILSLLRMRKIELEIWMCVRRGRMVFWIVIEKVA